jgi:hypothetical protein
MNLIDQQALFNAFPAPVQLTMSVQPDFRVQVFKILRCTAMALASGQGGLQVAGGVQRWLDAFAANNAAR